MSKSLINTHKILPKITRHPAKSRAFSASPSIFLQFSNEYKKIHHALSFLNNRYDYVKYGTTNELAIALHST